jgi:hypothetical protein
LTARWLGFEHVSVSVSPGHGTMRTRLLVPGPLVRASRLQVLDGRWMVTNGLIVAAIWIPL